MFLILRDKTPGRKHPYRVFLTLREEDTRSCSSFECYLSIRPSGHWWTLVLEGEECSLPWKRKTQEAVPALSAICPSDHQDIDGHWFWKKKTQEAVPALSVICPSLPSQDHQDTRTQEDSKLRGTYSLSNIIAKKFKIYEILKAEASHLKLFTWCKLKNTSPRNSYFQQRTYEGLWRWCHPITRQECPIPHFCQVWME